MKTGKSVYPDELLAVILLNTASYQIKYFFFTLTYLINKIY